MHYKILVIINIIINTIIKINILEIGVLLKSRALYIAFVSLKRGLL